MGEQREGCGLDGSFDAIKTRDAKPGMLRAPLSHRVDQWKIAHRDAIPVEVLGLEHRPAPLIRTDGPGHREALAQQRFGGLVVEDQDTVDVNDEHRRGQIARQLPRQDQKQTLVLVGLHAESVASGSECRFRRAARAVPRVRPIKTRGAGSYTRCCPVRGLSDRRTHIARKSRSEL